MGTAAYYEEGGGNKWKIIVGAAMIGVFFYLVLSFFGLPLFLVFGYIQGVNDVSFGWIFSMTGATKLLMNSPRSIVISFMYTQITRFPRSCRLPWDCT